MEILIDSTRFMQPAGTWVSLPSLEVLLQHFQGRKIISMTADPDGGIRLWFACREDCPCSDESHVAIIRES